MWHPCCMTITFGPDPIRARVQGLLSRLERGDVTGEADETALVDFKEDPSRRGPRGQWRDGDPHDAEAAKYLAQEAACMANTPGSGALIVGVSKTGELRGAALDGEWLRFRIYELTGRSLTVDVQEVQVNGVRLLVLYPPAAVEPIRVDGRIRWRVDDNCAEVDASTWFTRQMYRRQYDWSGEASNVLATEVRATAVDIARAFLYDSGDERSEELAQVDTPQLLRRLNVVTEGNRLTNAGVLAFVGRPEPALDYTHHEVAGADSSIRVHRGGRSLLEELADVLQAFEARNTARHVQSGLTIGQLRDIPQLAAREALVNGLAHREWGNPMATRVEHIGRTLRVTSPGGFFGGVNPSNIITHPSVSRNPALTQLLANLRVAERQGIGVDRMVREMVRVGHPRPEIEEIAGPYVRTTLVGESLDEPWMGWLNRIEPRPLTRDVSAVLILRHLVDRIWIDGNVAASLTQVSAGEAQSMLERLRAATIGGDPLLAAVAGTPDTAAGAWRLSAEARRSLQELDDAAGHPRASATRRAIASDYARARGRISTTELAALVEGHATNMGATLRALEADGLVEPSTAARRGRGFFYRWVGANEDTGDHA